jgi:hypothetical protein
LTQIKSATGSLIAHFAAKQLEDHWIGCLTNSPNRYLDSLGFQVTQASPIHKRFRVLSYRRTTKLRNTLAGQTQNDRKSR